MAGYGQPLVLDWSAFAQYLLASRKGTGNGRLGKSDHDRFEEAVLAGELHVCDPFRLETLSSAQSAAEFSAMTSVLDGLPQAPSVPNVFDAALAIQRALAAARAVAHRVKLADLLVAAVASENGLGVLHYDKDYATISAHGGITLPHVWVAKQGSLTGP